MLRNYRITILRLPHHKSKEKENKPIFQQDFKASTEIQAENYGNFLAQNAFNGEFTVEVVELASPINKARNEEYQP